MTSIRTCRATTYLPHSEVEVDVSKTVQGVLLSLSRFLMYCEEERPSILSDYIANLSKHYKILSEKRYTASDTVVVEFENSEMLAGYPELVKFCTNYVLSLFDLPSTFSWESPNVKTTLLIQRKAALIPSLERMKQFSESVDANWTKEFLQEYADYFVRQYRRVEAQLNLTAVFEADAESMKNSKSAVSTCVLLDDGRYAYRTDKCLGHEALKECNEPEFAYLAICAGDFEIVRKTNENFVLTRSHTLMDGPYCDGIVHDTRVVKNVEHKPDSFFIGLDSM